MKTLTVTNYRYELRAVFNEKCISFCVVNLSSNREVMSYAFRRSLAEKIPVQHAIKNYLTEQIAVVSNLLEDLRDSGYSQFGNDLIWQDFMLETALSLAEQAIAYYEDGEE